LGGGGGKGETHPPENVRLRLLLLLLLPNKPFFSLCADPVFSFFSSSLCSIISFLNHGNTAQTDLSTIYRVKLGDRSWHIETHRWIFGYVSFALFAQKRRKKRPFLFRTPLAWSKYADFISLIDPVRQFECVAMSQESWLGILCETLVRLSDISVPLKKK
jgi:hypothetical protein